MNKLFYILDRYKYGFVAAFAVYIGVFIYLELETVEQAFPVQPFFDQSSVEIVKEELELTPENVEIQATQQAGPVKNMARDVNDTRQRSMDDYNENKASSTSAKSVEQSVKEYERQLFAEAGGAEKRKAIQQEMENRKSQTNKASSSAKQTTTNQKGGNTAFAGNVMVDWMLVDRSPHQNNNWYVRNPGYTCGHGSTGRVYVQISVNANGTVTNATYVPSKSSNANGCMIEQAVKYAKMSRFSYSSSAPKAQEGNILYTFVAQ